MFLNHFFWRQQSGSYNLSATVARIVFPIAFDHFLLMSRCQLVRKSGFSKCVRLSPGEWLRGSHGNHIKMLSVHNLLFISFFAFFVCYSIYMRYSIQLSHPLAVWMGWNSYSYSCFYTVAISLLLSTSSHKHTLRFLSSMVCVWVCVALLQALAKCALLPPLSTWGMQEETAESCWAREEECEVEVGNFCIFRLSQRNVAWHPARGGVKG